MSPEKKGCADLAAGRVRFIGEPLQRIAEPEDHAGHYVLLASRENAGLTTANIIHSDGGWEIRSAGPTRSRKA